MKIYIMFGLITLMFIGCHIRSYPIDFVSSKTYDRFTFYSDSTFNYQYGGHSLYKYSSGTWKRTRNNHVLLQSSYADANPIIDVIEFELTGEKSVKKVLRLESDIPNNEHSFYRYILRINDSFQITQRCDSSTFLLDIPLINTIQCGVTCIAIMPARQFDTLNTNTYRVKSPTVDSLEVNLSRVDSLFNYQVINNYESKLTNRVFIYKGNRLKRWKPKY
jgi:hypothetical protein